MNLSLQFPFAKAGCRGLLGAAAREGCFGDGLSRVGGLKVLAGASEVAAMRFRATVDSRGPMTSWHSVVGGLDGGGRCADGDASSPSPCGDKVDFDPAAYHRPVLLQEVIAALRPEPDRVFFDGTVGGGGHSEAMLTAGARVVACDRDPAALIHAGRRLGEFGDRLVIFHGSFTGMRRWLDEAGVAAVDGILLDLGVSSRQLDDGARGFSFRYSAPLDMRMDPRTARSAADWVAEESAESLERVFREYGEERAARRVAAAVVKARAKNRIETTDQLAAVVESVIPRFSGKHPATKVFQALRIAVNGEMQELEEGLRASFACLKPGGRLAVISFHSLEDRMVKVFFKNRSLPTVDRPEWPAPRENPNWCFEPRLPKPVVPDKGELAENPRARSARLRVAVLREV